jgi:hypothetical protein
MRRDGSEQRRSMTFKRLLTSAALFAFLVFPAAARADELGGGAVAPPTTPSAGAATVSGSAAPATDAAPAADPGSTTEAVPAQDETPTTPEGEEQPPAQQPDGEQAPTEQPSPTPPSAEGGVGGTTGGGLPRTGFELLALTSIGLGLLLAGAALWPTSSWPPPRDRLSRSTSRG